MKPSNDLMESWSCTTPYAERQSHYLYETPFTTNPVGNGTKGKKKKKKAAACFDLTPDVGGSNEKQQAWTVAMPVLASFHWLAWFFFSSSLLSTTTVSWSNSTDRIKRNHQYEYAARCDRAQQAIGQKSQKGWCTREQSLA
jgi:hypothetical protein